MKMGDQLPLYSSFSENEQKICILCKQSHDDRLELGNKFTYGEITIHLFCAVIYFLLIICIHSFINVHEYIGSSQSVNSMSK